MSRSALQGCGRRRRQTRCRSPLWFLILLLTSSTTLAGTNGPQISSDELLAGTALGLGPEPPDVVGSDEVMALSDEMREFLENNVSHGAGAAVKVRQLAHAIISKNSFGLEYDETTRTAAETFRARRGNCLSFTFMFVVMARGVGLDASFQEVEIPPEWTFTGDTYVFNRHINIYFDLGMGRERVVDFNMDDFQTKYDMRIVSDERALAHYFNNVGAELLQHGELTAAFYAFRKAIAEDVRGFPPAWANLGTLYNRKGLPYHAEAAYLKALEIDGSNLIAMSNLTALYDLRGDAKQAARYRNRVNSHRQGNPYYRYQLARDAFFAENYGLAIDHLKYAVRKHKNEDRFCFLLGLTYLQMGDEKKSLQWIARAEELAKNDSLKNVYSSKIKRLMSASR